MKLSLLFLFSLDRNLKPKGVEGGLGANNEQHHNCLGTVQVYARHTVGFEAALVCAAPKGLESGMVYEGFTVVYECVRRFNSR